MAKRFVRVDLSDVARDFRPVAVEPGVPWLDHSQANAKILHKWLGGLVAEPEWEGESVSLFVQDDQGGRLEDVACEPAGEADLKGPLKADLEALRQRISRVKPETSTERGVHKTLLREFAKLGDDEHRADRDKYFFRYKDANGRWRLVWCWGYQRGDREPGAAMVCRDPKCNLLFLRRPGQGVQCPSCEALQVLVTAKPKFRKRPLLVGLLLLLLGAVLIPGLLNRQQLVTTPSHWTGPAGSRVEFSVRERGLFGFGGQDVTGQAVAVSGDPRIARIDRSGMVAHASSPGRTFVRFSLGDRTATATLTIGPAKRVKRVFIEPKTVELGIGTTTRLTLIGDAGDGVRVDLTEDASWPPSRDGIVFSTGGLLEGMAEGSTQVVARYQATPDSKPLEAMAEVSVTKLDFRRLEVGLDPLPIPLGRGSKLHVSAMTPTGKRYSVLESSRLTLGLTPSDIASVEDTYVEGRRAGRGKLEATWNGKLSADISFDVAVVPGVNTLVVSPEQLDLIVGEIADLDIASPSTSPIRLTSVDPSVAEVTESNRVVGRCPGTTRVTIAQDQASREVSVNVTKAKLNSIAVKPAHVVVPIKQKEPIRVIGQGEGMRRVELAPDVVKVEKRPAAKYASLDEETLELLGVQPTEEGSSETLGVAFETLQAQAPVEIILPPGVELPPLTKNAPREERVLNAQGSLVIEPATATLHPGQGLVYQVTGVRQGVRKVLGLKDGVTLSATSAEVGKVDGMHVQGNAVGTTEIIARWGDQQAKTVLKVVAGSGAPATVTHTPGVRIPIVDKGGYWVDGVYHSESGIDRHGPKPIGPEAVTPNKVVGKGAPVSVVAAGEKTVRFESVRPTISDEFVPSFTVKLEIAAARSAHPLEYRAYVSGQSPTDNWTPAQPQDDRQLAVVTSPPIQTGPFSTVYDLTVEARNPADDSIEQYPLRFRLAPGVDVQARRTPTTMEPSAQSTKEAARGPSDDN